MNQVKYLSLAKDGCLTGAGAGGAVRDEGDRSAPDAAVERAGFGRLAQYRRILLLQGPNGPFFARLRDRLVASGCEVWKINFNGGDDLFYRGRNVLRFTGAMTALAGFLATIVREKRIDAVVVFGDRRRPHRIAARIARQAGVAFWVFEEGYMRPDYITLEAGGVNARSGLATMCVQQLPAVPKPAACRHLHHAFARMAWYSFWYFAGGLAASAGYPRYRHHKPFGIGELACWIRAGYRKLAYRWHERRQVRHLLSGRARPFFVVALQVYNDSQIRDHSPWRRIGDFIEWVMFSFARHAPPDCMLVIKHHPMDRGHTNYAARIRDCARRLGVDARVHYVHDAHLPTLLQRCEGLVTINSTAGLQALFHGVPVIALGRCFYAKAGVTFQDNLDRFWSARKQIDVAACQRLRQYVIHASQINSSFYADTTLQEFSAPAGWPRRFGAQLACLAGLLLMDVLRGCLETLVGPA